MAMKRTSGRIVLTFILVMTALTCQIAWAAGRTGTNHKERSVAHKRIAMNEYQNFLKNWDENKQPVHYALIQTPAQYDALFAPAALMGTTRPFAPATERYAKEQILMVARVIASTEDRNRVFEVEKITESDQKLLFHYRFTAPKTKASSLEKNFLALWIPKQAYKTVSFFENGKLVGALNSAKGEWSVPKVVTEAHTPDAVTGTSVSGNRTAK
jgi:hypothetical protein